MKYSSYCLLTLSFVHFERINMKNWIKLKVSSSTFSYQHVAEFLDPNVRHLNTASIPRFSGN